ncbi:hypothetical protein O3G_MSEX006459 [Manduca sexta]|uniref:Uncharacterized protein n=1 Tax=Manduca sexta TaxID=7130 RepID=A0A922CLG2_MANSE|nr:hypothetical protein O3G_MSEX006459 [Manduca sexta]
MKLYAACHVQPDLNLNLAIWDVASSGLRFDIVQPPSPICSTAQRPISTDIN